MPPEKICYVVGAGDFFPEGLSQNPDDFLIAADGGYLSLQSINLTPDLVIGDFDSLGAPPSHPRVLRLKTEKEETDMIAALSEGLKRGYRLFHIYGGTGKRLDHTLANIQTLAWLAGQNARGILFGQEEKITLLQNSGLFFPEGSNGTVSVFSHDSNAYGVEIRGLKYPLQQAHLTHHFPLGVSNELVGKAGFISVRQGKLLVLYPAHINASWVAGKDCSASLNML